VIDFEYLLLWGRGFPEGKEVGNRTEIRRKRGKGQRGEGGANCGATIRQSTGATPSP